MYSANFYDFEIQLNLLRVRKLSATQIFQIFPQTIHKTFLKFNFFCILEANFNILSLFMIIFGYLFKESDILFNKLN